MSRFEFHRRFSAFEARNPQKSADRHTSQDTTGFIFGPLLQAEEVRVLGGVSHVRKAIGSPIPKVFNLYGWYKPYENMIKYKYDNIRWFIFC